MEKGRLHLISGELFNRTQAQRRTQVCLFCGQEGKTKSWRSQVAEGLVVTIGFDKGHDEACPGNQ